MELKPITNTFLFFTNSDFSQVNDSFRDEAQDTPENIEIFIRAEKLDGKTPKEIYDKCYNVLEKINKLELDCMNIKKSLDEYPDRGLSNLKKCSDTFEESLFLLAKYRNKMLIVQRRMKEEMENQKERPRKKIHLLDA